MELYLDEADVYALSSAAYFDESNPINEQNVTVHGSDVVVPYYPGRIQSCYFLVDESGNKFLIPLADTAGATCNSVAPPLPPTPPAPETACSINNGNALNVNLGQVDRAQLPTVAGSGSIRHIPVSVDCTGGVDVDVNLQLSYTPVTMDAAQVIKSTSNGLGIAVIYEGKTLSNSDVTPVTFLSGSNSLDLGFKAVRDATVEIKDIPTGAFTASAVLVMTQQ
ncbi:fimbrial protein [Rahnella selenatireducens]|uniref:fimbrial protein n=1 Tax=Rahnella selenatireducens TaxID=3389797 RepID=UPI0039699D21